MQPAELACFEAMSEDRDIGYEIRWHLAQLRQTREQTAQVCRNRRFRCMQELEAEGEFFSDHSILMRCPQIYQAYLGRLLPKDDDSR